LGDILLKKYFSKSKIMDELWYLNINIKEESMYSPFSFGLGFLGHFAIAVIGGIVIVPSKLFLKLMKR